MMWWGKKCLITGRHQELGGVVGRTFSLYFPGSGYPISIPFSTFFVLFVIHRDSAFSPLFILNLFFDLCENGVDGCTKTGA